MKLREIMTTPVQSIDSGAGIQDAALKMKDAGVGMLSVTSGDRLVGVVTDRDIVVRGVSQGRPEQTVREVMTSNPICVDQETNVEEAIAAMSSYRVGRLVVTDEEEHPVGVVSAGAIAIAHGNKPQVGRLAEHLSVGHRRPED